MRGKVVTNFIWRLLERGGAQGINLVVSIILARKLGPEAYGVITLANVFIAILQVFVEKSFGTALVQKKDSDDTDFSSVFYFNIVLCLALYALVFFASPLIGKYYELPEITPIIRALGLVLIVAGLRNVQQAYVSKKLLFRKFFFSTLIGTICGGTLGIYMAYAGYGAWALVGQTLTTETIGAVVLLSTVEWRPKKLFSWDRLKTLINFGWKLLVASLIDTIYNKLVSLIIGKKYTTSDLAYYNKGIQLPSVLVTNICTALDSVLLTTMANVQDDKVKVKELTRKSIELSAFIIMPMMVGVFVCANPIISLLLTDTWLPCVPYLRIFCITYAFHMIHSANLNAVTAIGRSDIYLKLEIIKKGIGVIIVVASIRFGIYALALSSLFSNVVGLIVNCYPNKKLLDYGLLEQLHDILPSIISSIIMGAIVYLVSFMNLSNILMLLIQVPLGVFVYYIISKIRHFWGLDYLLSLLGRKKND